MALESGEDANRTTTERLEEPQSVAEVGVTDAALHDPKDDLIGTSRLAKGLSLFLCHKKTRSPLTIAIAGPWGSGKSSIMGMLQTFMRGFVKLTG